ncbi:MAG: hypothetical protein OXH20_05065 [bacterium]|nr:hypothetical protein [bacterium]
MHFVGTHGLGRQVQSVADLSCGEAADALLAQNPAPVRRSRVLATKTGGWLEPRLADGRIGHPVTVVENLDHAAGGAVGPVGVEASRQPDEYHACVGVK